MTTRPLRTVLYLDHSPKMGGAAKILMNLISELPPYGIKPIVVCPADSDLQSHFSKNNIEVAATSMPWFTRQSGPSDWISYMGAIISFTHFLKKLIKNSGASLLHANGFIAALYCVLPAKLSSKPVIWHMHDILEIGPFNRIFIRIAGWNANRIICVSEAVKSRLLEFGVNADKCRVLYNFLPEAREPEDQVHRDFFTEYAVPHNAMIIGMIGNICRLKGQMVFLQAIREIAHQHPAAIFVVIGDTLTPADQPYKDQLLETIKTYGLENKLILTGFRKDAFWLLKTFGIFVHPATLPDSLPQVLLEAMYHRKPVIASNIGGIPEIVVDGVTGLLVPPQDAHALAHALDRLMKDPDLRARFGAAGNLVIVEKFSRTAFLKSLQVIYEELLIDATFHSVQRQRSSRKDDNS